MARLQAGEGRLGQQEALAALVVALGAGGVFDADELHAGGDRRGVIGRAQEFLASRVEANPTLDDLAGAVGANKFVLLRRFRRELGTTPHGYLLRLRVERARALLARGVGPTDAAAAAGFADLSHLTRHFKRLVGLPPGSYARPGRAGVPTGVWH